VFVEYGIVIVPGSAEGDDRRRAARRSPGHVAGTDAIVAIATEDHCSARSGREGVVARASVEAIVARQRLRLVKGLRRSAKAIRTVPAAEQVVAIETQIIAGRPPDDVVAGARAYPIVPEARGDAVIPVAPNDDIRAVGPDQIVITVRADDGGRDPEASR